jgi:hypothetical protein
MSSALTGCFQKPVNFDLLLSVLEKTPAQKTDSGLFFLVKLPHEQKIWPTSSAQPRTWKISLLRSKSLGGNFFSDD